MSAMDDDTVATEFETTKVEDSSLKWLLAHAHCPSSRPSTHQGVKVISSFDEMNLKEELLRGLYAYGFEKPSAIQQRAVLPIVGGRDVIAQAQSGTGKSSLIAVTTCQLLETNLRE